MAVLVDVGSPDLLGNAAGVAGVAPHTLASRRLRRPVEVDGQLAALAAEPLGRAARDQAAVGLDEDGGGPEVDLLAVVLEDQPAVAPHVHVPVLVHCPWRSCTRLPLTSRSLSAPPSQPTRVPLTHSSGDRPPPDVLGVDAPSAREERQSHGASTITGEKCRVRCHHESSSIGRERRNGGPSR